MLETIIGAVGGFIAGWAIIAGITDAPKYPGDTHYGLDGPGCALSLVVVISMAVVGGFVGIIYL